MQKYEIGLYSFVLVDCCSCTHCCTVIIVIFCDFTIRSASQARSVHVAKWYELHGIVDTRDTCAVSRYFVLLRYTAVYRDLGDTGIVT